MHTFCLRCACRGKEHRQLPAGWPCQSTPSYCLPTPALLHHIVAMCPRAPGTQCDSHRLLHQSCRPGAAWLHLDPVTLITSGTMPWSGCSPWGRAALQMGKARDTFQRQGRGPRAWLEQCSSPAVPSKTAQSNLGCPGRAWGASTCRVRSKALAHKTRIKKCPNISWLSRQLGNANTQYFSQSKGRIKSTCDCAANEIRSESQTLSSAAAFCPLSISSLTCPFFPAQSSVRIPACSANWMLVMKLGILLW